MKSSMLHSIKATTADQPCSRGGYVGGALLLGGLLLTVAGCGGRAAAGPQADATRGMELRKTLASKAPAESEAAGAAEETATGWATLSGKFNFTGARRSRR